TLLRCVLRVLLRPLLMRSLRTRGDRRRRGRRVVTGLLRRRRGRVIVEIVHRLDVDIIYLLVLVVRLLRGRLPAPLPVELRLKPCRHSLGALLPDGGERVLDAEACGRAREIPLERAVLDLAQDAM